MNQGVRNTEELLVLTCTPQDTDTVIEWRPFKHGNTLGEIVTAHNLRCDGILQERTPREFTDCLQDIKPAVTIGACVTGDSKDLDADRLGRVKILLLDLDSEDLSLERLEPLRQVLSSMDQMFHLIQISQSTRLVSWSGFFAQAGQILSTDPEVFTRQSEVEAFFHYFRETYENSWNGVIHNPLDAPCLERVYDEPYVHPSHGHFLKPDSEEGKSVERIYRTYRSRLPNLLTSIRDTAMMYSLPEDQVINLGRSAAIQELLLTLIAERTRPTPTTPVSVEAIRVPPKNIPAERSIGLKDLQKANLLAVHRLKPIRQLNDPQLEILERLGMNYGVTTSIHHDAHETRELISQMGDVLGSDKFTAELPVWPVSGAIRRFGLSEISFGLDIRESQSKDMEVP